MTFRQCLTISFFAHLLAVGAAPAFVRFSGTLSLPSRQDISVSLVSLGAVNASRTDTVNRQNSQNSPLRAALPAPDEQPAERPETKTAVLHVVANPLRAALPVPDEQPVEQPGTKPADKNIVTNQVNEGHGAEAEYGKKEGGIQAAEANPIRSDGVELISPEQWAAIETAISRNMNYPRIAKERGIEGIVRLRFKLNPSGTVDKLEVIKSSGSDVLDGASVQAVYRAAPMPYVEGWVEVPIAYVLK